MAVFSLAFICLFLVDIIYGAPFHTRTVKHCPDDSYYYDFNMQQCRKCVAICHTTSPHYNHGLCHEAQTKHYCLLESRKSDPRLPPTTKSKKSDPRLPPTTGSRKLDPQSPPTTGSKKSDPQSPPTTGSRKSAPQSPPTTESRKSDPQSPTTTGSRKSDPQSPPTTESIKSDPQSPPTTESRKSDPQSPPTTGSRKSDPQSPPPTESRKSDPQSPPRSKVKSDSVLKVTMNPVVKETKSVVKETTRQNKESQYPCKDDFVYEINLDMCFDCRKICQIGNAQMELPTCERARKESRCLGVYNTVATDTMMTMKMALLLILVDIAVCLLVVIFVVYYSRRWKMNPIRTPQSETNGQANVERGEENDVAYQPVPNNAYD